MLSYDPVNWQDSPSRETALDAEHLNTMDTEIAAIVDEVNTLSSTIASVQQQNTYNTTDITNIKNRLNNLTFVTCTRAQYNAMASHPATTVYIFVG